MEFCDWICFYRNFVQLSLLFIQNNACICLFTFTYLIRSKIHVTSYGIVCNQMIINLSFYEREYISIGKLWLINWYPYSGFVFHFIFNLALSLFVYFCSSIIIYRNAIGIVSLNLAVLHKNECTNKKQVKWKKNKRNIEIKLYHYYCIFSDAWNKNNQNSRESLSLFFQHTPPLRAHHIKPYSFFFVAFAMINRLQSDKISLANNSSSKVGRCDKSKHMSWKSISQEKNTHETLALFWCDGENCCSKWPEYIGFLDIEVFVRG